MIDHKKAIELRKQFKSVLNRGDNNYLVLYKRNPTFTCEDSFNRHDYVYLVTVQADDKEKVYHVMQGEVWSPLGEARELITTLELQHTSMSVGDLILVPKTQTYYMVDYCGFREVKRRMK